MSDQTIAGGRELDAFLRQLAPKVEKNIMRAALRAGANEFKAEVKQNLASNGSIDRGELAASVRVSTRSRRGTVYASVKAGGKRAPHWHWVEFGTRPHKIIPKKAGALNISGTLAAVVDHPGAKPKPYMRPAFDAKSSQAIQAVAAKIRERLTKEGINVPAPETE